MNTLIIKHTQYVVYFLLFIKCQQYNIHVSGSKYTAAAQPHSLSTAGERKSPLTIMTLEQADHNKKFRAKITYAENAGENFAGGEVISGDITLKVNKAH